MAKIRKRLGRIFWYLACVCDPTYVHAIAELAYLRREEFPEEMAEALEAWYNG